MPTNDPKFLKEKRKQRCIACGSFGVIDSQGQPNNEAHHILAKGMGNSKGGDDWWNIITLCSDCHTQAPWAWHRNLKRLLARAPHLKPYLELMGWIFLNAGYKVRLIHPAYRDCKPKQKPHWEIPKETMEKYLKSNKSDQKK